jgi:uncharacterized protein (DUF983 family)
MALLRGLKGRCPSCGKGKLFERWNVLYERCLECDCVLRGREDDTWFFMYISAAAITGIFIIGMFFILPANITTARFAVAAAAIAIFLLTTGPRKGVAIAIDFFVDSHSKYPRR